MNAAVVLVRAEAVAFTICATARRTDAALPGL
jgi:hypothetical protein